MCVSCGCGQPEETYGDDRNITLSQLQDAADADPGGNGLTLDQVAQNIQKSVSEAQGGQTPEPAQ